jgi:hypothetical protein
MTSQLKAGIIEEQAEWDVEEEGANVPRQQNG